MLKNIALLCLLAPALVLALPLASLEPGPSSPLLRFWQERVPGTAVAAPARAEVKKSAQKKAEQQKIRKARASKAGQATAASRKKAAAKSVKSEKIAATGKGAAKSVESRKIATTGKGAAMAKGRKEADAAPAARLDVRSALVLDIRSGRLLYQQNVNRLIPPASLTKVMSMLVTFDAVRTGKVSLKDKVRVSRKAARTGGSRMYLREGEKVSLEKLLMGMAVSSGNDASVAVAEHVAGSTGRFVRLMNATARRLGMKNTVFRNVNGLPAEGQVTTARDMSLLARYYLRRYPEALRFHRTRTLVHRGRTTTNRNPLLGRCSGADGLKTGWINASGYNIISTARRGDTRLLAVVMGAPSAEVRSHEIFRLVEAGFAAQKRGQSVSSLLANEYPAARIDVAAKRASSRSEKAGIKRSSVSPSGSKRSSARTSPRAESAVPRKAASKAVSQKAAGTSTPRKTVSRAKTVSQAAVARKAASGSSTVKKAPVATVKRRKVSSSSRSRAVAGQASLSRSSRSHLSRSGPAAPSVASGQPFRFSSRPLANSVRARKANL